MTTMTVMMISLTCPRKDTSEWYQEGCELATGLEHSTSRLMGNEELYSLRDIRAPCELDTLVEGAVE